MGKCNQLYQDTVQYVEDNRFYFWWTIDREETQFEVDVTIEPTDGMLPCVVMTGVRKGEEVMLDATTILNLYNQQNEKRK